MTETATLSANVLIADSVTIGSSATLNADIFIGPYNEDISVRMSQAILTQNSQFISPWTDNQLANQNILTFLAGFIDAQTAEQLLNALEAGFRTVQEAQQKLSTFVFAEFSDMENVIQQLLYAMIWLGILFMVAMIGNWYFGRVGMMLGLWLGGITFVAAGTVSYLFVVALLLSTVILIRREF